MFWARFLTVNRTRRPQEPGRERRRILGNLLGTQRSESLDELNRGLYAQAAPETPLFDHGHQPPNGIHHHVPSPPPALRHREAFVELATRDDLRTPETAVDHLRRIRRNIGLDGGEAPEALIRNLEAASNVLSDQLYQKSTRFIIELIQNADDNDYELGDSPAMNIRYDGRGHVLIDCNEVGFSPADVEAICEIGLSSKTTAAGASKQRVGEKGIGFKSVFKAADVVWVASGDYSFKFDRASKLGMIAPIIESFPAERISGCTSFYLQLSKDYDTSELMYELKALDPKLLIFLRRLKNIGVVIDSPPGSQHASFSTALAYVNQGNNSDVVALRQDDTTHRYVVRHHTLANMPLEQKRKGLTESEIHLAFPIDDNGQPRCEPQHVYAFLPIRPYGFNFLLQADFLLIASREDVSNSCEWNRKLRDGFEQAFLDSVHYFNDGPLKYLWPRFVPEKPDTPDCFFSPLKKCILETLRDMPVLESWIGAPAKPKDLTYVPERFCDEQGVPFTLTRSKHLSYVSKKYNHSDSPHLQRLGVVKMDNRCFIKHLKEMVVEVPDELPGKPPAWHSQLACAILSISETSLPQELRDVPLIQLQTEKWVSPATGPIFFSASEADWSIPGGLELLVAHASITSHDDRARLYRILGVKNIERIDITNRIMDMHRRFNNSGTATGARDDLVAQIVFLYKSHWVNKSHIPFWFFTECGECNPSRTLYHDSDSPHAATKLFAEHRNRFSFIHSDYLTAVGSEGSEGWLEWLRKNMDIQYLPRLVAVVAETITRHSFVVSEDFKFLVSCRSPSEVLHLLCEQWREYSAYLEIPHGAAIKIDFPESRKKVVDYISSIEVSCKDPAAGRCLLKDTFVPLDDLVSDAKGLVPFLDIPEPSNSHWEKLINFGVGVKQHVRLYLRCLEKIKDSNTHTKEAHHFMGKIQMMYKDDENLVKKSFRNDRLICVPDEPLVEKNDDEPEAAVVTGRWYSIQQCVWEGPRFLKRTVSLAARFPDLRYLLVTVLEIRNYNLGTLVNEAAHFNSDCQLSHIRDVFIEINKILQNSGVGSYKSNFEELKGKKIWPVATTEATLRSKCFDRQLRAASDRTWFIIDRKPLGDRFAGTVPLCVFQVEEVVRMETFLTELGLQDRRLSMAARSEPDTFGKVEYHVQHTEAFRSKHVFIRRLIPIEDKEARKKAVSMLPKLEVYTADSVTQQYSVISQGARIKGQQVPSGVAMDTGEILRIYLKKGYLETQKNILELVSQLASYCGILERHLLLHLILMEPDVGEIEKWFDESGIPEDRPDLDAEDDSERDPRGDLPDPVETPHAERESAKPKGPGKRPFQKRPKIHTPGDAIGAMPGYWEDSGDESKKPATGRSKPSVASSRGYRMHASDGDAFGYGAKAAAPEVDEGLQYIGHSEVSKWLQECMKGRYKPEDHWTSKLRTKTGHAPWSEGNSWAPFTIQDAEGAVTEDICNLGYTRAESWISRPPVWHIEVKVTAGGEEEEFPLSNVEFDRIRRFSVQQQLHDTQGPPANASLLVHVFNARGAGGPGIQFYPDPWFYYLTEKMKARSSGYYKCKWFVPKE